MTFLSFFLQIVGHKDANLFRHPVKEEHAQQYYEVANNSCNQQFLFESMLSVFALSTTTVALPPSLNLCAHVLRQMIKEPLDLATIKQNIDNGVSILLILRVKEQAPVLRRHAS